MKNEAFKSLGVVVNVQVPESADEFDKLAGRVGACLESANSNVVYRQSLAEFREKFTAKVEEDSKVARETKEGKDGESVFDETEAEYFRRVLASLGVEADHFQPLADEVAAGIVFDPSERERKPAKPGKLAKTYLTAAETIVARGQGDKFAQKYQLADASVESIARKIKDLEDAERAKTSLADKW